MNDRQQKYSLAASESLGRLVSIVIINFNYGDYLAASIESALAQTYDNIEIIVVDDGSTDRSTAVLATYAGRVQLIRQPNLGHVRAFNTGYFASSGYTIIFLDADDVLYSECVATVVRRWGPSLSKIQYRLDTIDEKGRDVAMPFPHYPDGLSPEEIARRSKVAGYYPWPVSTGNAYARSFLSKVMPIPFPRIWKSPDGYVNKVAPLFGDVGTLPVVLAAYRVHDRNQWAQSPTSLSPARFARTVRFDADLHAVFVQLASERGIAVGRYGDRLVPQWIEQRILSLRFNPDEHPIQGDRLLSLLHLALRAARHAEDLTVRGRVFWAIWFLVTALCPKRLLLLLLRRSRTQGARGRIFRLIVGTSRV